MATTTRATTQSDRPAPPGRPGSPAPVLRVLVLHEPGAAGIAALDLARELDLREHALLTVVALAPMAESGVCTGSARVLNEAVKEAVERDLEDARERLAPASGRARYQLLVEGEDPPLEVWAAARGFNLILLPTRRRLPRRPGHPAAARLRRATNAEVRVVERPRR